MNIRRFIEVIARFRFLIVAGLLIAATLAALSFVRVSLDGGAPRFEYRSQEQWQSSATLFVTQEGFPWGRSVLDEVVPVGPEGEGYVPRYSDANRLQTLALLYAELAMSDDVRGVMLRDGPVDGEYLAAAVRSQDGSSFLPLVEIAGLGATPGEAEELAGRVTDAFLVYLRRTQQENAIPDGKRVDVQVIERPREAELLEGRRLTRPIFLFILVMSAFLMLAFVLENVRPRVRPDLRVSPGPAPIVPAERKSA